MDLPSLTNVLVFFEDRFGAGRSSLLGDVKSLATILVTFEIVFAGIYLALGSSADMKGVARKILTIGFFFYVIKYYGDILRWVVDGFLYAGEKVGSGSGLNFETLRDPAAIFIRGMQVAKPLTDKIFADIDSSYFGIPSVDSLMLLLCIVLTVFSFAIMSIQVFVTYLEYILVATAGFIIIPFGIFKPTAFLAERVFGAIVSFGIKLMVLALIVGVSEAFLKTVVVPVDVSWQQAIELSVIALSLAFLALHAPGVAQSLLSGSPHLSTGTIAATAAGASYLGSRMANGFSAPVSATISAAGALHGGGAAAASALGSLSEEKSLGGKAAKMASKAAMYGVGSVGGLIAGATTEGAGKVAYGNAGAPNGARNYREQIGDPTLKSSRGGRSGTGGLVGSFNAGRFSVPQYRSADAQKRKEKASERDSATVGAARQEQSASNNNKSSEQKAEGKV
jgi:type IV secretion system protein TrbL